MSEKTLLDKILHDYPRFFTKDPDSNHVKYHTIVEKEYLQLKRQQYLVELAKNIKRPVKLWKEQSSPYSYMMNFEVNMKDIKSVKLYDYTGELLYNSGELIYDSGILPEGVNTFFDSYNVISDEIIPTIKYFLEVEDYHDNQFYKGSPENKEVKGDIYDHDSALDVFGINFDIPRRIYRTDVTEDEYPYTEPPFSIDESEPDYYYENRILESMGNYNILPLPATAIKQYFGVLPKITGRWRYVTRMDETLQDEKFMQTSEWNSSVFDVVVNAEDIPKNLTFPTEDVIQSVVNRTFPLSKKAYLSYVLKENIGEDDIFISDENSGIEIELDLNETVISDSNSMIVTGAGYEPEEPIVSDGSFLTVTGAHDSPDNIEVNDSKFISNITLNKDINIINDSHALTVTGAKYEPEDVEINDKSVLGGSLIDVNGEVLTVSDSTGGIQHDLFPIDNESDFDLGTYVATSYDADVNGVILDGNPTHTPQQYAGNGVAISYPRSNCGAWVHPDYLGGEDDTGYASATFTGNGYTDWLKAYEFGLNVPSDAIIDGLQIRIRWRVNTGTMHRFQFRMYTPSRYTLLTDDQTTYSSWGTSVFGSYSDVIDYSGVTPDDVNNLSVRMIFWGDASPHMAMVSYVTAQVWYHNNSGTYTSKALSKPNGSTWNKFTAPLPELWDGCDYDILDGSTNTLLKHADFDPDNGINLDISDLNNASLKFKAYLNPIDAVPPTNQFSTDKILKF